MDLAEVELLVVNVPLRRPFVTARSTTTTKRVLLVRIRTGDGVEGWGECSAESTPTYAPEYVDGAWSALASHLVPRLRNGESVDAIRGHHMAKAALEMAWLDARGRASQQPLASMIGGRPGADLPVGVVVDMGGAPGEVAERAAHHVGEGYRRVKVKITPECDSAVLDQVRLAIGDGIALWADANGSYRPDDAGVLRDLDVDLIEQPFAAGDLVEHAALVTSGMTVAVSLDESIASVHDARSAIALRAANSLVVKVGRVGGVGAAVEMHDHCIRAGMGLWCGGMLETGIGRAANLAVASLPGFTNPGDLSASDRYFTTDLTEAFVLGPAGTLRVPSGAGLGVEVDLDRVRAWTERRAMI